MKIRRVLLRIVQIVLGLVGVAIFAGVIYATSGAGPAALGGLRWTDETPAWSPNGKEIVFASNRPHRGGGIDHLYLMRPDGTHLRRLTRDRLDAREPSFSPDGKQIVFAARVLDGNNDYTGHGVIELISADGAHRRRLTPGLHGDASIPAWSPDGRWVAFVDTVSTEYGSESRSDLYVVRNDGTDRHRLAINIDGSSQPLAWAPNSKEVAVVGADERIYRLGVDARKPVRVTQGKWGVATTDVAWSPDGSQIAYVRGRIVVNNCFCDDDGSDVVDRHLWILDLATHRRRRVRSVTDSGSLGDFGVTVTWLHGRRPSLAVYGPYSGTVVITPRGRKISTIYTPNGGMITLGSASADGRKLLFVDGPDGSYRSAIFAADVRNGRVLPLTQRVFSS
jgi:Tol biopolymer transport system component